MTPAAYAVIDLEALRHNLNIVRRLAPASKIMAVIKANAYGHGLMRIAQALYSEVNSIAVARVHEAVRLREYGINNSITVLQGFVCQDELQAIDEHQLIAVIHCHEQLALLSNFKGIYQQPVWLKMDTGMNRLGFKAEEIAPAYQRLKSIINADDKIGLMTHLSDADQPKHPKTRQQIELFKKFVGAMQHACSIANSAAVLAWPEAVAEWVRPGLMLFGCSPFADKTGADFDLRPVMSLQSRLIAVKNLEPGETVGYGGVWTCQRKTRLGVIAIGYGDGYPRAVGNGTPVLVNGQRVPLVGRVSMDMITVDLAALPEARPGDPVTLWGAGLAVEEIAAAADTIPYTLLCGITQRVQILEQSPNTL